MSWIKWIWSACAGIWLASPIVYEFSGVPFSVPIAQDRNGTVRVYPWGLFTSSLEGKYANVGPGDNLRLSTPSVTMITENPKLRTLSHELNVKIVDYQKFFSNSERWEVGRRTFTAPNLDGYISDMFQGELYSFNNAHSKDLASFFNPYDADQQATYQKLMRQFLGPALGSNGLDLANARFTIR